MNIGIAQIDITPQCPIRLSGFGARVQVETADVLSRLYAKAIVFGSDAEKQSIFITVDLITIQFRITSKLAEQLSVKFGLSPSQITICASHTHGGPETGSLITTMQYRGEYPDKYYFSDALLELDQLIHVAEYNEMLSEKLEEVAITALKNSRPAIVAWGQGEVSFAVNRRTEGGPVDLSMPMIAIKNLDGTLRGVLVNYACHGISLGPDVNQIHGDWMGEAQKIIEARHHGAIAMVAIGCAGDAHPVQRDRMEYPQLYGKQIADAVDHLLCTQLQPITLPPVCKMKWIKLPFANVPTVLELIEFTKDTTIKGYYARLALERIQRGKPQIVALDYPIQTWSFEDKLLMINMAGEVVVDYAVRLKEDFGADRIWINAFSNDVPCYIASRRVIREGGYEADASMYCYDKPSPLAESVEDNIITTVHELTPTSFK